MDSASIQEYLKQLFKCPEDDWSNNSFKDIMDKFSTTCLNSKENSELLLSIAQAYARENVKNMLQQEAENLKDLNVLFIAATYTVTTSNLIFGAYLGYMLKMQEIRNKPISLDSLLKPFEIEDVGSNN